jgi:hypothetical protein
MSHHDHDHEHTHAHTHAHAHGEDHDHLHDHEHAHQRPHDHGHQHDHDAASAGGSAMTLAEKAARLLDHWIRHNNDHAATYRQWADRLQKDEMIEAAGLLAEAADMCVKMNDCFSEAAKKIRE